MTVWLVARPGQELVLLTAQVRDAVGAAVVAPARPGAGRRHGPGRWRRGLRLAAPVGPAPGATPRPVAIPRHAIPRDEARRERSTHAAGARAGGLRWSASSRPSSGSGRPRRSSSATWPREADPETAARLRADLVAERGWRIATRWTPGSTPARPQYPVVGLARMDRVAAALRPMRDATLARDAGPGGDRRVGRARRIYSR